MSKTARIKLITFDAFNTLFKPKGSVSTQYVRRKTELSFYLIITIIR
jgi:FMN phosphatase YigB (HAD superfamily)